MLKMALFDSAINEECWSVALFFPPHPWGFDSSRVPTPGNLPSKAKKMLMPGGQPGGWGCWAQLKLTDALVFSNCFFILLLFDFQYFFRLVYNSMEIISSRSRTVKWWIPRKKRHFYVFGCSTMSTIFADLRIEVRRYRRMDMKGFNVVLETFSFDLKV